MCLPSSSHQFCTFLLSDLFILIITEINIPPVAHAGPDISIQLPNDVVELDGSESTDDKGIVSYEWKRNPKSPAAGVCK